MDVGKRGTRGSFFHFIKFVMNFFKGVVSICHSFQSKGPGSSLRQFFIRESLGLLQPKVEGPEVKVGGATFSIKQRKRTKIKPVLGSPLSTQTCGLRFPEVKLSSPNKKNSKIN